ncbi:hypothetical protein GMJAKD_04695 [Candidatus Electrothrix aarhusensis]
MNKTVNETQKYKASNIILWGCVVIIFFITGFFLYQESQGLNLQDPQSLSSLEDTIEEIETLDSEYAEAIKNKKEFHRLWSMIAVIVAVLTSAAIALRAPQPFVIIPGAFVALIYAAIELQSPKTIIKSLVKARGSLSCVEANVNELLVAKKTDSDNIKKLINIVKNNTEKIKTYSVKLEVYHRRLGNILQINVEERHAATLAVNKGLMIPFKDNSLAIKEFKKHLEELSRLEGAISNEVNIKKTQQLFKKQEDLRRLRIIIENAIAELKSPRQLKGELKSELNNYMEQLILSKEILDKSEGQLQKALIASSKSESIKAGLKKWPKEIEIASSLAIKTVSNIHNTLIKELEEAGAPLEQVLASINQRVLTEQSQPALEAEADMSYIQGVTLQQQATEAMKLPIPLPFDDLEQEISSFESAVKETLKKIASDIENARTRSLQLQKVINNSLLILIQAAELFEDATKELEATINEYRSDLNDTLSAIDKSEEILNRINFVNLKSRVESCLSVNQAR